MKKTINLILKNDLYHAKWLNTLAYLEHIGSRKIIKSQNSRLLDYRTLKHIAEEARHALFLKKICKQNFNESCPTFEHKYLLGGDGANKYFQKLDHYIHNDLPRENHFFLNYLYVTFVIEERALSIYTDYQALLTAKDYSFNLTPLLVEETQHLNEAKTLLADNDADFMERIIKFSIIEKELFADFINEVTRELDLHNAAGSIHA